MKKLTLIVIIALLSIPTFILAEEAVKTAVGEPLLEEVIAVPEKSEDQKNLDILVQNYKDKKEQLRKVQDDLLRIEGAILFLDSKIKQQTKKEEGKK